ncbi:MAG: protein kinase [Acidobacteriota bacterium]|nr:protein kinase [Acidobacteriota bacterium]
MSLVPGTRLGPYEVIAPIGAGGMGEVWRGRDTRLDRSVAIKILPAELADNAQFKLRFEREAKTISQLNHPNICTLYDVGENYLVMELLEGESLAERLARGALPLDQVIRYGIEIAEALEKAHKAGVVHRDLKPGNIMITKSGAKLLDFGLAKEAAAIFAGDGSTQMRPLTADGVIVGTLNYMAPEQLEGRTVDARSDIFALGAVLYEMAAGKRAFEGSSKASLIASILTAGPPSITAIQPMTPALLDRVVRTCLQKDPDHRWQSAQDVATALRWIAESAPPASPRRTRILPWAIAALLAVVCAVMVLRPRPRAAEVRLSRFVIDPPPNAGFNFSGRDAGPVVVSPDGSRIAFVATTSDGAKQLWVRNIDSVAAQALAGTVGASYPFWSADGENLGFFADGKLKRVSATGGAVTALCDAPSGRGGAWNREGTILFSPSQYDALYRVPASGGQPAPVTLLDKALSHRWPAFFPDGRHFLYLQFSSAMARGGSQEIYLASLDQPRGTVLMRANSQAIYVDPGYLLYIRDSNLMATPFDAQRLGVSGEPFPVADHAQMYKNTANGVFSASNSGVLAYQEGGSPPISHLTWYDRHGKALGTVGPPDDYEDPRLSPDGRHVAVTRRDPDTGISNIWLYDTVSNAPTRFSYFPTFDHIPSWSTDGKRIVFDSNRNGVADIYVKAFGGEEELLYRSPAVNQPTDWSPDGSQIVFQTFNPTTKWDLWTLSLPDRRVAPLLREPANEKEGQISPDGKWIAYTSDEAGRPDVYVTRFPSMTGRWQISSTGGGGSQPRWRRDGKEIFFLSADRKMMSAEVRADGADFSSSVPQALFQTRARYTGERCYDVSADGQRFAINTMVLDQTGSPIVVVLNWAALRGSR